MGNYRYWKYIIWWVLKCIYTYENITIIKIIIVNTQSFLVTLCSSSALVIYWCVTNYSRISWFKIINIFFFYSFCGLKIWAKVSWILWIRGSQKAVIKESATEILAFNWGKICFQAHLIVIRIQFLVGSWIEGLISYLRAVQSIHQFLPCRLLLGRALHLEVGFIREIVSRV